MQWLVNALVTDDVKKRGGGAIAPYLKHISLKKSNFPLSYRDRVSAKNIFPTLACEKEEEIFGTQFPFNIATA